MRSGRSRRPVVAPALRIGGTVEYRALAASYSFCTGGKKIAPAAGLAGIRRLLRVVIQLALLLLGRAEGVRLDAYRVPFLRSVRGRVPSRRSGDEARRQPPERGASGP